VDSILHLMASNIKPSFLFLDITTVNFAFEPLFHTSGSIALPFDKFDFSAGFQLFLLMCCSISFNIGFLNSGASWALSTSC
jgi:hypothetical protein